MCGCVCGGGAGGGGVVEENVRSKRGGGGDISEDLFSEKIYQKIPYSPPLPPSICLVTYVSSRSVTFGLFVFKIEEKCQKTTVSQGHELCHIKISRHSVQWLLIYRPQ